MNQIRRIVPFYAAITIGLQAIGRFANMPALYNISLIMVLPMIVLALWLAPARLLKTFVIMAAAFIAFAATAFIPAWLYAEFIFQNANSRTADMVVILACVALGITAGFIVSKKLNKKLGEPLSS